VGQTHHMPSVYKIAEQLHARGTKVILGGMHVTEMPEEALKYADAVIIGEGESVWEEILKDFTKGILKKKYYGTEVDLSKLPPIRRDLFSDKFYHPGQIIETTRGCPVGCHFCAVQNFFGNTFRVRPPEAVKKELMDIFGPRPPQAKWKNWLATNWHPDIPYFIERRLLYVMDSNLMSEPAHARKILEVFKECDIRWYGHTSFNLFRDESMLDLLAESGCMAVNIGFESLSQSVVDKMHKSPNITKEYTDCIKALHDREIGIMGTFMVGFDEDTLEVFDHIVDFAIQNRLETAFTLILTPLPGTKVCQQMVAQNRIFSKNWRDYDHGTVTFYPQNMTPRQLHLGMRSVWKRIYSWKGIYSRILKKPRIRPFFFLPVNMGFRKSTRLICSEKIWPVPQEVNSWRSI
ncbi:MAG: B12-binding domain-containing radical SAM protein, partial [Deltaproteobacteria bacterium]|nr:B12-binding domain-containing radical SAM protein [Deltaproteobacteria bacterium]